MDTGAADLSGILFSHLKKTTDDFSIRRIIEDAGVGTFFKETMPDGELVSMKILKKDDTILGPPDRAYNNEVRNIERLKHKNIAKLVGYCSGTIKTPSGRDTAQHLICYEHLSMGSLESYLFGPENIDHKPIKINWDAQFKIIQGICQGLHFLHKLDSPIIHMDIKPVNIWLDSNLVPKIVNFGVSKLLGSEEATKLPIPAMGYMTPEYCHHGEFSVLSDIYSLGILIIEITTGEKTDRRNENVQSKRTYIKRIRDTWKARQLTLRYPRLNSEGLQNVKACLDIGLKCVEVDLRKRPSSLDEIVQYLGQRHGL